MQEDIIDREQFREDLAKCQRSLKEYNKKPKVYTEQITKARRWIETYCRAMLFQDPSYFLEYGIDGILWKERFYKPIEAEREALKGSGSSASNHNTLTQCIQEGIDFYYKIFQRLKSIPAIESSTHSSTRFSNKTKLLLNHSVFIHLGDLHRYLAQMAPTGSDSPDAHKFDTAEMFYKQAIALDPSNGNGHHQLAVLSTYQNAQCMAVYRYCRSIACKTPFPSALKNVKVQFVKNEKELVAEQGKKLDSKKAFSNMFIMEFIQIQKLLSVNAIDEERFMALLHDCICHLIFLLKKDTTSTPLIFRIVMISIFAADDCWRPVEEMKGSQMNTATESSLFGWIALFSIMSYVIKYTAICLNGNDKLSLRHLPTVCLFIQWLELQKPEGYRPRYMSAEASTCIKQKFASFGTAENVLWNETIELLNRLPLIDSSYKDSAPLLYEVEVRGFTPFKGIFDCTAWFNNNTVAIPPSKELCSPQDAEKRYMITSCVSLNKIIMDPRCPVRVRKGENNQFLLEPNSSLPNPFLDISADTSMYSGYMSMSSKMMSFNPEDETPFQFISISGHGTNNRTPSSGSLSRFSASPGDPFYSGSPNRNTQEIGGRSRMNGISSRNHSLGN